MKRKAHSEQPTTQPPTETFYRKEAPKMQTGFLENSKKEKQYSA